MKHSLLFFAFFLSACTVTENMVDPEQLIVPDDLFTRPRPFANPANDDEYFFNYRLANFAPDTEELIKETFGSALIFDDAGLWERSSYTSHVVGFTTNLPTLSIVEYGRTADYGERTVQSESYFYQHLHYIKGLEPDSTYHYRILAMDYDGTVIASADHTFTLQKPSADVIRIPEDMEGDAPYVLTRGDAKYVLTRDITVPTLAINIKTHNVELDLDGHTIIYDDGASRVPGTGWNDYAYNEEATFGIRAGLWNFTNFKIYNGTIKQGRNGGAGIVGIGFSPLFLFHMGATYNEIAGITVDYYGASISGFTAGDGHIHHNVLYDRGTVIDDRHMAIRALQTGSNPSNDVSFNSLRRFRHRGIGGSGKTSHNELYSDSFDTNSFALGAGNDAQLTDNKIFGMGYLPIGIGWSNNIEVKRNFIYMRGFAPTMRSEEYSRKSAIAGMRVTNYGEGQIYENMLFEDNVIVLKPEDGCTQARGIWTTNSTEDKNIVYRRNTVKVEAMP
ncbi:MAG: fibronectin type III domain-containing protein, partial [Tannerellaceae bacterium]|nr:fibronectin type III domain-containing protein [Tannerellaceae bacterium]